MFLTKHSSLWQISVKKQSEEPNDQSNHVKKKSNHPFYQQVCSTFRMLHIVEEAQICCLAFS